MQRLKKHKIKKEIAQASTSSSRKQEEHDLSYYIHDRVELMHQVFSVLKSKEIKMLAPECVRHISMDNLQELCTEELLGISSKRLLAILDGADPPTDTESSSPSPSPQLETISLDSISSDEEILSHHSGKKKKHKHRRRNLKKKSTEVHEEDAERSKASRAGLTVLELLELQARARAIRAQLHQEQTQKRLSESAPQSNHSSSENEVEIKEEPAEVVEISSDEEKPKIEELERENRQSLKATEQSSQKPVEPQTKSSTRIVQDLVITVPQAKASRKIKLNRTNKVVSSAPKEIVKDKTVASAEASKTTANVPADNLKVVLKVTNPTAEVQKKSRKRKKKIKVSNKVEEVDNDEITLQLSDSEKMDLLESLERRKVSSSEDSASSSEAESVNNEELNIGSLIRRKSSTVIKAVNETVEKNNTSDNRHVSIEASNVELVEQTTTSETEDVVNNVNQDISIEDIATCNTQSENNPFKQNIPVVDTVMVTGTNNLKNTGSNDKNPANTSITEIGEEGDKLQTDLIKIALECETEINSGDGKEKQPDKSNDRRVDISTAVAETTLDMSNKQATNRELSEGEVSDRDSSEVEAVALKPEIVCLSGEENDKKKKRKKEKKVKKAKKEKKNKKVKADFPEGADQNFYKNEQSDKTSEQSLTQTTVDVLESIILEDDYVLEILELSDDSSCYEVEGTILSKEPTASEIEALSATIDNMEREDVVTQEQIIEYETLLKEKESIQDIENISWKDRYLDSKKVKKVLTTSNIFNAMRKKNKELRQKLDIVRRAEEEAKKVTEEVVIVQKLDEPLEEGSIDHYNMLQGSTRYVDPVKEVTEESQNEADLINNEDSPDKGNVSREMKKDAKQLLKMYKKLLKYNNMERKRDPSKKKKKKSKSKDKQEGVIRNESKNMTEQ